MRIVVDAWGTDERPVPDVAGAVMAAQAYPEDVIILVGDETIIGKELEKHHSVTSNLEIVHATDEIFMDDKPSEIVKDKKSSSMHVGMGLVRDGSADAFVTMGNTGAAYAVAMLGTLKRIPGIKRPALTTIFKVHGREMIFLDMGANSDCKPEWMVQFAMMGSIYAKSALQIPQPRIATLSNGEEEGKGNQLLRDTQVLMRNTQLNYVGHIEPKEILQNKADVVVMDGFVGNIFLKTFEGSISYFADLIRDGVMSSIIAQVGGLLLRPVLRGVRQKLDTNEIGGAPLLGVNGIVIVGHGGANALAVKNAVNQARRAIQGGTLDAIVNVMQQGHTPTPDKV
jgi:glycerol-3-phosphate acyltransferase PlsX